MNMVLLDAYRHLLAVANSDSSRTLAIAALLDAYDGTRNRKICRSFANIVADGSLSNEIRMYAYISLLLVAQRALPHNLVWNPSPNDLIQVIDWSLVNYHRGWVRYCLHLIAVSIKWLCAGARYQNHFTV